MHRFFIIIPTYNEIENIHSIISSVLGQGPEYYVLVVDDNSPDGTAEAVIELIQKDNRIFIHRRKGKLGLGTAYIEGFKKALELGATHIFEMDADFSHNPSDLKRLVQPILDGTADISIGSRYTKGGSIKNWPMDRLILSYGASLYVRMITWMPVKDPTAGYICYKSEVLRDISLDKITFLGYAFQIEMKYACWKKGYRLYEVPIVFSDRIKGKSKMHSGIISEAIKGVLHLRWRGMSGYYN